MYITFLVDGEYSARAYAFHKLQAPLLFGAFSLTIRDWMQALVYLKQVDEVPWLLNNMNLYGINLVVWVSSILCWMYLIWFNDIDAFSQTPLYSIQLLIQVIASIILSFMMLNTGLLLSYRIGGVVGND